MVQLGTHSAAIIVISARDPPSPARCPSMLSISLMSAAISGSIPLWPASSSGLASATIRTMTTLNRKRPATIHCQMRVRAAGVAASRRACISGVVAARRAAPKPPRMQKAAVIAMVRGTAKTGVITGMSAG